MSGLNEHQLAKMVGRQLVLFPAFHDARGLKMPPEDLVNLTTDAYENDQLTQEQDLILEFLLYLAGWTEEFHMREALTSLGQADYNIMMTLMEEFRQRSHETDKDTVPFS